MFPYVSILEMPCFYKIITLISVVAVLKVTIYWHMLD